MSRREIREQIFKTLFQIEFYTKEDVEEQLLAFIQEQADLDDKNREYIQQKVMEIYRLLEEIDAQINEKATGWKTNRMAKADLALLRLAVYEMKYEEDIPTGVAINEAVELAKQYGSDDSAAFINGVLAKLV